LDLGGLKVGWNFLAFPGKPFRNWLIWRRKTSGLFRRVLRGGARRFGFFSLGN